MHPGCNPRPALSAVVEWEAVVVVGGRGRRRLRGADTRMALCPLRRRSCDLFEGGQGGEVVAGQRERVPLLQHRVVAGGARAVEREA